MKAGQYLLRITKCKRQSKKYKSSLAKEKGQQNIEKKHTKINIDISFITHADKGSSAPATRHCSNIHRRFSKGFVSLPFGTTAATDINGVVCKLNTIYWIGT